MILYPVQGGSSGTGPQVILANCDAGDLVGDAVRISSDKVAGLFTVSKVDIDSAAGNDAFSAGVIISKSDPLTCRVQWGGVLEGVYSGLTPGFRLFVDENSRLQEGPPARPSTGRRLVQELAYALASDTILINPLAPIRVVAP